MKNFKKFNDLVFNITKQIYKRHDNNFLLIINNWKQVVGENFYKKSFPKKINIDKTLIVSVDNDIFLEFQYETENFKKKINTLLENSTINKIKLKIK